MFLGTHLLKLDDKGRLFLPARFRPDLWEGVVVTKGQERCLFVFAASSFEAMADKQPSVGDSSPATPGALNGRGIRDHNRIFFASASAEPVDKQGRINLPANLRSYAGLSRDCAVIGMNNRVEIWDAAAWAAYEAETEPAFAAQSEEVLPGIV